VAATSLEPPITSVEAQQPNTRPCWDRCTLAALAATQDQGFCLKTTTGFFRTTPVNNLSGGLIDGCRLASIFPHTSICHYVLAAPQFPHRPCALSQLCMTSLREVQRFSCQPGMADDSLLGQPPSRYHIQGLLNEPLCLVECGKQAATGMSWSAGRHDSTRKLLTVQATRGDTDKGRCCSWPVEQTDQTM
jgi:hypothetical protein